jgi:hypothetical protein
MTRAKKDEAKDAVADAQAQALKDDQTRIEAAGAADTAVAAAPGRVNPENPHEQGAPEVTPEIKAEVPFGADPDDLAGIDPVAAAQRVRDEQRAAVATFGNAPISAADFPQDDAGKAVAYAGPAAAITVIVPDGKDPSYDDLAMSGTTYTLERGKARFVRKEHVKWLTGHPAHTIEEVKGA